LQAAVAGVLGAVILGHDCLGGRVEVVAGCALVFGMLGYMTAPRSLGVLPAASRTVTVAGICGALAECDAACEYVQILTAGLLGGLIAAFLFLGLGWKPRPPRPAREKDGK
jgi:hypothetical protein